MVAVVTQDDIKDQLTAYLHYAQQKHNRGLTRYGYGPKLELGVEEVEAVLREVGRVEQLEGEVAYLTRELERLEERFWGEEDERGD